MMDLRLNELECKRVDKKANENDKLRIVIFYDGCYEIANTSRWEYLIGNKNHKDQIFTYRFIEETKQNKKDA